MHATRDAWQSSMYQLSVVLRAHAMWACIFCLSKEDGCLLVLSATAKTQQLRIGIHGVTSHRLHEERRGTFSDESDLTNAYRFPLYAPTYNQDMMAAGEEVAALCRSAYCNWLPVVTNTIIWFSRRLDDGNKSSIIPKAPKMARSKGAISRDTSKSPALSHIPQARSLSLFLSARSRKNSKCRAIGTSFDRQRGRTEGLWALMLFILFFLPFGVISTAVAK